MKRIDAIRKRVERAEQTDFEVLVSKRFIKEVTNTPPEQLAKTILYLRAVEQRNRESRSDIPWMLELLEEAKKIIKAFTDGPLYEEDALKAYVLGKDWLAKYREEAGE